jgi:hypothetical protein
LPSIENVLERINQTGGIVDYKHSNGVISQVNISEADKGPKSFRVANLPPEVPNDTLKTALTTYGCVTEIRNEKWANFYRYSVPNGIRQVTINLNRHVPSHLTLDGNRILLSYDGQPPKCYGWGEVTHTYQDSPNRSQRRPAARDTPGTITSFATILQTSNNTKNTKFHQNKNTPYVRATLWREEEIAENDDTPADVTNNRDEGQQPGDTSLTDNMTGLNDTPTEVSREEPPTANSKVQEEMGLTDPSPSPRAPIQEDTQHQGSAGSERGMTRRRDTGSRDRTKGHEEGGCSHTPAKDTEANPTPLKTDTSPKHKKIKTETNTGSRRDRSNNMSRRASSQGGKA